MTKEFELIVASVLQLCGIVATLAAVVIIANKYLDSTVQKAKEKSVGAAAIEAMRAEVKKNSDKIESVTEHIEELRQDMRDNGKEYLNTLKELASKFRNP